MVAMWLDTERNEAVTAASYHIDRDLPQERSLMATRSAISNQPVCPTSPSAKRKGIQCLPICISHTLASPITRKCKTLIGNPHTTRCCQSL